MIRLYMIQMTVIHFMQTAPTGTRDEEEWETVMVFLLYLSNQLVWPFCFCLQMQPQGLIQSGPTQAFFHTANVQPQSTVGYIEQQQPQQQHLHSQSSASSLSDYRNILPR